MRKKLVVAVALLLALLPVRVSAGSFVDIVVKVSPDMGWLITNFTATYISDTQVDLSWTPDPSLLNVVIRAKYGSEPSNANDGYLVYSGLGNSCSDTSMNFDENLGKIYYKAFGETVPGVYGVSVGDNVEGIVMLMIALVVAALILMVSGYVAKKPVLAMAGGGFWMLVAFYAFSLSAKNWASWDIYLAIFFVGVGMVIASVLEPAIMREKPNETVNEFIPPDEFQDFGKEMDSMRGALFGMYRRRQQQQKDEGRDIAW